MLFLDTSALVKRYVAEAESDFVLELMDRDTVWAASALARLETQVTLCHLGFAMEEETELRRRAQSDWERFAVVPLIPSLLDRAVEMGCNLRLRTLDAIHLSAAAQFPRPLTFLTFDSTQAAAAATLGFELPSLIDG
ncbi:MAG: type II toxin-antitoxin system VapC family toxin [Chloroflexota bacterium]|nr:type II toxin-antitoxin system VapC family toxin [Chloroflexota bacterium]